MKRALSRVIKSIVLIFSFFLPLFSHDNYISFGDQSFTLTPLSEQGTDYFKKMDVAAEAAQHGFVGADNTGATPLTHCGTVKIQQGNIV